MNKMCNPKTKKNIIREYTLARYNYRIFHLFTYPLSGRIRWYQRFREFGSNTIPPNHPPVIKVVYMIINSKMVNGIVSFYINKILNILGPVQLIPSCTILLLVKSGFSFFFSLFGLLG